jgi:hypothetical protein
VQSVTISATTTRVLIYYTTLIGLRDCGAQNMTEQFWITLFFLLLSFAADLFLLSISRWNVEHLDCGGGDSVPCVAVIAKPWYVP